MENISEDIGEEVISQLKELIEMIEEKFKENGNELPPPCSCGNRLSKQA